MSVNIEGNVEQISAAGGWYQNGRVGHLACLNLREHMAKILNVPRYT